MSCVARNSAKLSLTMTGGVYDMVRRQDRSQIIDVIRDGLMEAASYWEENFFDRRYSEQAPRHYPGTFVGRTREYRKRKRRKFGHDKPNVFSGRSKSIAKNSFVIERRESSRKRMAISVRFNARVSNFHTPDNGRINMPAELRAMNASEQRRLIRVVDRVAQSEVRRVVQNRNAQTRLV